MEIHHVQSSSETTSEAVGNYGSAVLLVGMAIFYVAVGVGFMKSWGEKEDGDIYYKRRESFEGRNKAKPLPKKGPSPVQDAGAKMVDVLAELATRAGDTAREKMFKNTSADVATRVKTDIPTRYYVKKAYKETVVVGSMIPLDFLVEKSDSTTEEHFRNIDNIKFKSRISHKIHGGVTLVEVEELLNNDVVKPV